MMTEIRRDERGGAALWDWVIAGCIALASVVFFSFGLDDTVHSDLTAALVNAWSDLEDMPPVHYPLAGFFYRTLGLGRALAPVCGAMSAALAYLAAAFFLRRRISGDFAVDQAVSTSRMAGLATAATFLLVAPMRFASTHFDPGMVDVAWALAACVLLLVRARIPKGLAWVLPAVFGAFVGFGAADTATFLMLLPLFIAGVWASSVSRGGRGYGSTAMFLLSFFIAWIWCLEASYGSFGGWREAQKLIFRDWSSDGEIVTTIFATAPFVLVFVISFRAFSSERNWVQIVFHAILTLSSILVLATPISVAALLQKSAGVPVFLSAFAAFTVGYVVAYWWNLATSVVLANESVDERTSVERASRPLGLGVLGVYVLVLFIAFILDLAFPVRGERSSFRAGFDAQDVRALESVVGEVVGALDGREWFVTDGRTKGLVEKRLLRAARGAGVGLEIIDLSKENDEAYVERLAGILESNRFSPRLVERLREYGILAFIQDWFSEDPDIAKKAVVFGVPEIWRLAPGCEPTPEKLFFGGDPSRAPAGPEAWRPLLADLAAPEGWGSDMDYDERASLGPVLLARLDLRRHVGFLACVAGGIEHRRGLVAKNAGDEQAAADRFAKALSYYEFVLREVDKDNVVAIFNEKELAQAGFAVPPEADESNDRALDRIRRRVESNPNQRYITERLPLVYGYLANPEVLFMTGVARAARGGDRETGLENIRSAIAMMPADVGAARELGVLAPLYVTGDAGERAKARETFDRALAEDPGNYTALVNSARLAMLDGDTERAIDLFQRAVDQNLDDGRISLDLARLYLLKGDTAQARAAVLKATDADDRNLAAWALRASVALAQIDEIAREGKGLETEGRRAALDEELRELILPRMERVGRDDPVTLLTRSMVRLHGGEEDEIAAARADLEILFRRDPKNPVNGELLLKTLVSLGDVDAARRRAEDVLRADPAAPYANWVLGSIALQSGDTASAERFLQRAAASRRADAAALNDLAECLRRKGDFAEAERVARRLTEAFPGQYVSWETLGSIILDGGDKARFSEAEGYIQKACNMSRGPKGPADFRMVVSLARAKLMLGNLSAAKTLLDFAGRSADTLDDEYRALYERLRREVGAK